MRKIIYSKVLRVLLFCIFSLFYDKKYLKGKYFKIKRIGWYWAFIGLKSRLIGPNSRIPWPVNPKSIISNKDNIYFDINDISIFQTPGCYWQNHNGKIYIGSGCQVAPNVGIITTNHDPFNLENHLEGKDVKIGNNCWIGMNAMILPGVELGDNTIVGAGSVVTKSFSEGMIVIAGNPAKVIKRLKE